MSDVWYEIVMTNALIRSNAVAILTVPFAYWFTKTGVSQRETFVACAAIWCCASAIDALFSANRCAMTVNTHRITVVAGANFRCRASTVIAICLTDRHADVSGSPEIVTSRAIAGFRRNADAHHAGLAANRFADACIHRLVTIVAGTNSRRRARTESATFVTYGIAGVISIIIIRFITI